MKHGLNSATVDRIRSVLAGFSELDKATLYGSRAKGTYKPGSDIDLALFGSDLDASILSRITSALDDLLLPYKIDLSIFANISNPNLLGHIERVGVVFYEKHPAPVKS
jgi:predicted nucleotidyltransferase